jgi:hypothetical protein
MLLCSLYIVLVYYWGLQINSFNYFASDIKHLTPELSLISSLSSKHTILGHCILCCYWIILIINCNKMTPISVVSRNFSQLKVQYVMTLASASCLHAFLVNMHKTQRHEFLLSGVSSLTCTTNWTSDDFHNAKKSLCCDIHMLQQCSWMSEHYCRTNKTPQETFVSSKQSWYPKQVFFGALYCCLMSARSALFNVLQFSSWTHLQD